MSKRLVILAPNWLGDAVMALPAIADVRRAMPDAAITVAARPSVAPLFALVPEVDDHVDSAHIAGADIALLFPNAFRTALLAWRAGVPERWGYRTDGRGLLLTRGVDRPTQSVHQVDYYRHLIAELAASLARDGVQTVMVGSAADVATATVVAQAFTPAVDLVAKTNLPTLAGVFTHCRTLVTNDSGAMHLAAAVGLPVTAVFGPTRDAETRPRGDAHAVITNPVWCRPCMLRECPLDHRCLRNIDAATVVAAARRTL